MSAQRLHDDLLRPLETALKECRQCHVRLLPFSALAFLVWDWLTAYRRTLVVVTDTLNTQEELHRNLATLADTRAAALLYYPAWDVLPGKGRRPQADLAGDRLRTLRALQTAREPLLLTTCVQALMQRTPARAALAQRTIRLTPRQETEPAALVAALEKLGYDFAPEVQAKGQATWRGGLLDLWPLAAGEPCRIEFNGNTIDTIRSFDPADQRSVARLTEVEILPVEEWNVTDMQAEPQEASGPADPNSRTQKSEIQNPKSKIQNAAAASPFMAHLPDDTFYVWFDADPPGVGGAPAVSALEAHARTYETTVAADEAAPVIPFREVQAQINAAPGVWQCFVGVGGGDPPPLDLGFRPLETEVTPGRDWLEPDLLAARRQQRLEQLAQRAAQGWRVECFFNTPGALERFRETHSDTPFQLRAGALSDGFLHETLRWAVMAETEWSGRRKVLLGRYDRRARRPAGPRGAAGETITDWASIEPGDLVVHVDHGIGRYLGLYEIEFDGKPQEVLTVEYADQAKLYVPIAQTHLLSRYLGVGKQHALIHRLGGKRWLRERAAAEDAVRDLAASLLEVQARREAQEGLAFPPDAPWQHEFEGAFPYEETEDQWRAIAAVKQDMESVRPMDRLICGDVGYGKTEVAMRAAFKAVLAGKQVALLVPTTVLAQQHYDTFRERMGAYPLRVEWLCRFRSPHEQETVVRALGEGAVDIVIGTHRLLQSDVRFKDLGLVIIDEEQRFGVAHKERLKQVRHLVDVLTLTATPIPRTLYMSLTGARDISVIQTSPQARLPIETLVCANEDRVVREAILRELNRGGQVFYLHNRVQTIERVYQRLLRLTPEARIAVGHGQMPGAELAGVMHAFAAGRYDVLLCTTIIESGVDIPNVNTILIDRADRFGMADLYQLRGRVGRSPRKAYAYLLLPIHGHLLDASRKRIHAIVEHADLGAGFRLALRDLEIRGAGNLLGAEQSGHIAAVGFDLYCQLLRRTVAQLSDSGDARAAAATAARLVDVEVRLAFLDYATRDAAADGAACLPADYVEDERLRVSVYRKIAAAATEAEIEALREEFRDRFGPPPPALRRLLAVAALRILAAEKSVTAIEVREDQLRLTRAGDYLQLQHRFPRLRAADADGRLAEIRHWLQRVEADGFAASEAPAGLPRG